jgi:hypothetical protein
MRVKHLRRTPVLDRNWEKLVSHQPTLKFSWAPPVEIRRDVNSNLIETWFHMNDGEGVQLSRISVIDMVYFLQKWRLFLEKCENHPFEVRSKGWFRDMFQTTLLEDKLWLDNQGRYVGSLHLIQSNDFVDPTELKLQFGGHCDSINLNGFRNWLDMLDEIHKPFFDLPHNPP